MGAHLSILALGNRAGNKVRYPCTRLVSLVLSLEDSRPVFRSAGGPFIVEVSNETEERVGRMLESFGVHEVS